MIYVALHWSVVAEKCLWSRLHNNTLNIETKLTPEEMWNKTKGTGSALVNAHVFDSLVFPFNIRSQDGKNYQDGSLDCNRDSM